MQETQRPRLRAESRGERLPRAYWSRGRVRAAHHTVQRARALGWLSLGIGLLEIAAHRRVAKMLGLRLRNVIALGLREIVTGIALIKQPSRAHWLWGRVLGDAMDLTLLGRARGRGPSNQLAAAAVAHALITAVDTFTAVELSERQHRGISIRAAITVNRPIEEVYRFWHNFENLPRFMQNLQSVEVRDGSSRWRAKPLPGTSVVWEADVVVDRPNELIVWRSHVDSELRNAGSVRFLPAPGGRGTEVRVNMDFDPRGGRVAEALAKLFGKIPALRIEQDLRRFKQVMETGEVVLSEANTRHERQHER